MKQMTHSSPAPSNPAHRWPKGTTFSVVALFVLQSVAALAQPLYDNGPVANSVGTGFGGADESIMDINLDADLGIPNSPAPFDSRVADDFTVPGPDAWTLSEAVVYGYQDLSAGGNRGVISTLTGLDARIWDGRPGDAGSQVVFSSSDLTSSLFSGVYRVSSGTPGANNRPIMENRVSLGVVLVPGTYWIDWQTTGLVPDGGPFVPPIPTFGQISATGDALRFSSNNGWVDLLDSSSNSPKGIPFLLEGAPGGQPGITEVPINAGWALGLLGLALAFLAVTKMRG